MKIQSRVIQGMVMPGGWHYQDEHTTRRIEADTFPALIAAVTRNRIANRIPIGDPKGDVENYICTNFPSQCHGVPDAAVSVMAYTPQVSNQNKIVDRMMIWLDGQQENLSQDALIVSGEAKERAAICARCVENVKWERACQVCTSGVNRLSLLIRQNNSLPGERKLKACAVFGHENRAAVWLNKSRLSPSPNAPAHCWLRQ